MCGDSEREDTNRYTCPGCPPGMHFRGVEVVLSKQVLVSAGNTGDQCADSTALSNGAGHISIVVYMYTVLSCS